MEYNYEILNNDMVPIQLISDVTKIEIKRILIEGCKKDNEQRFSDLEHAAELTAKKRAYTKGFMSEGYGGYVKAMNAALSYQYPFSVEGLVSLYMILTGEDDKSETIFSSEDAMSKLECLIKAYEQGLKTINVHCLVIIACVVRDFVKLSPFNRGNERMGEIITWLLLSENGYDFGRYTQVEREKVAELFRHDVENDETPWEFVKRFILCLRECSDKVYERTLSPKSKKYTKKDRIENIVVNSSIPVTKAELQNILEDVSITTIEAQLAELCRADVIRKNGSTRMAAYMKNLKEITDGKM